MHALSSSHTHYPPHTCTILPTHALSSSHVHYPPHTCTILLTHALSSPHMHYPPHTCTILLTHALSSSRIALSSSHMHYRPHTHAPSSSHMPFPTALFSIATAAGGCTALHHQPYPGVSHGRHRGWVGAKHSAAWADTHASLAACSRYKGWVENGGRE
jgi:hypothetical protein